MDKDRYSYFERSFKSIFEAHLSSMSGDSVQAVQHYVEVAELEMAYESFILSVIDERIDLSKDEKSTLLSLGYGLGLDKESVFRDDFWNIAIFLLNS